MKEIILSPSKLKTWHHCHQAFDYKYNQNLRPKVKKLALARGSLLHEAIEAFHQGKDPWEVIDKYSEEYDKLLPAEKEYYGDLPSEARRTIQGYLDFWQEDPLEYVEIESDLGPYELQDGIYIRGKVDRMAYDRDGNLWVVDTKTHKTFPTEEDRQMNPQTVVYVWLARQAGFNPIGVLWDYVRTKAPAVPELLKKGGLSKRKNIDTTPEVYLQTIHEHGLDPADYADILSDLEEKRQTFFSRVKQPISEAMLENVLDIFYEQGLRIREYGDNPVRELNWRCSSCDYFRLCHAELYELDSEFIRRNDFIEERREDDVEESEEVTE